MTKFTESNSSDKQEIKWCSQHGYPLPCTKCGLGEREIGRKEVIDWIWSHSKDMVNKDIWRFEFNAKDWEKQLTAWGL